MTNHNCGFCNSPTDTSVISCVSCGVVFHAVTPCTGISANAIRCVLEEFSNGIQYICTGCRCGARASGTTPQDQLEQGAMGQLFSI